MKPSSSNRRAISLSKGGGPNNEVIAVQPEPGVAFSVGAPRLPSVRGSHEHDASTFTYHNRVSYANLDYDGLVKALLNS